jgi:novobiocin biosynthesis protein NovU/D-mycarose 3-C-methyltransferase
MKRTNCAACGAGDLEVFLDLGMSPIADAYTDGPDLDVKRYPLQVATCPKCHLAQLLEVVDPQVLFGTGYSFYSSASPPLSAYHQDYAMGLLADHSERAAAGVLEIGCNDGDMLRHFALVPHLGVDPATGPTTVASEQRRLDVINEAFSFDLARDFDRKFGLVIANHVLAHVADVSDVIAGIAHVLAPNGLAFIEVQYLPDLLVNNTFDLVYHEHRNYFSLSSLEYALWRHGLRVVSAELTDRQGGSLRVAAGHRMDYSGAPMTGQSPQVDQLRTRERWLMSFGAYESMQGRAERIRDRLLDLLDQRPDKVIALYGAPAKATTLLNFCRLTYVDLPYCWDTTEAKQQRHIPGTGIEIRAPWQGSRPDVFLLAAWNYLRPIMKGNPGFEWIVPFPAPLALS